MDTKSTIGFIVSCLALFAAYTFLFAPSEEELEAQRIEQQRLDSLAKIEQPATIETNTLGEDTAQKAQDSNEDSVQFIPDSNQVAPAKTSEDVVITTKRWEMTVNTKGGLPKRLALKDGYVKYQDSTDVELWDHTSDKSSMNITFEHNGRIINTEDLYFTASTSSLTVEEDTEVVFASDLGSGSRVEIKYMVYPDRYDTDVTLNLVNAGKSGSEVILDWNTAALHQEKGIYNEQLHSSVFFKTFEDGRDYLSESTEDEELVEDKLNWVAHKQNYFSVLAISESGFGSGGFVKSYPADTETDKLHSCYYETKMALTQNHSGNGAIPFKLYMGPNDLEYLETLNTDGVEKIPDYGWTIFGWVNRNAIAPFYNWMDENLALSAGILIFLLTLVVKTILFPVQWKNYMNSAKMKVLKPEIDEINKKFEGKNAMEKQQATMALYKQTGVNPMAGCLPALLQMPILYAMFRFFPANIDFRQKSFLWADDLGSYDAIINLPFDIPLYGAHVSGFTVLMAISMFFYTRMSSGNMPQSTQPGMPNMKMIMNIFPVMMLFFFNKFAAGLSLYYFLANVFSIGQMLVIKKFMVNEVSIRAKIEANKKKPAKKKSAFSQRLEDMQKEQQKKIASQKKDKNKNKK